MVAQRAFAAMGGTARLYRKWGRLLIRLLACGRLFNRPARIGNDRLIATVLLHNSSPRAKKQPVGDFFTGFPSKRSFDELRLRVGIRSLRKSIMRLQWIEMTAAEENIFATYEVRQRFVRSTSYRGFPPTFRSSSLRSTASSSLISRFICLTISWLSAPGSNTPRAL
jgi:hypothetical protein